MLIYSMSPCSTQLELAKWFFSSSSLNGNRNYKIIHKSFLIYRQKVKIGLLDQGSNHRTTMCHTPKQEFSYFSLNPNFPYNATSRQTSWIVCYLAARLPWAILTIKSNVFICGGFFFQIPNAETDFTQALSNKDPNDNDVTSQKQDYSG